MLLRILICILVGYGCGCFSTAYVIGKRNHVDIRKYGSGNAGTTNAMRTLGKKAGILTFLGDFLKALLPVLLVRFVLVPEEDGAKLLALYMGLGVALGHNFPFWLKFKGGKGIAVTGGAFAAADPRLAPLGILVFGGVALTTKYVSIASLCAVLYCNIWMLVTEFGNWQLLFVSFLYLALAVVRHIPNLKRLRMGTEHKIGESKVPLAMQAAAKEAAPEAEREEGGT